MVKVIISDLFESKAQTLVNTVNCVSVMGKGIALEFKKRFPDMYEDYVIRCKAGQVKLGEPYLYRRLFLPWIINFPTKDHWRSVARIQDIILGLRYLQAHYKEWGITSLAVPPLGCGEGLLEWRVVGPTLYRYLSKLEIPVELYAPYGTPPAEMAPDFLTQPPEFALAGPGQGRIKPGWIAIVEILNRIEKEPYHRPIGRTSFQKIAYFATEKGIPTDLKYSRGSYGPYTVELKAKITQLVNNGLINERPIDQMLEVKVGPTFKDAYRTYYEDIENYDPVIDQISDLFLRMTTKQAETAATVHFAVESLTTQKSGDMPSENEVLEYVKQWKQKRRPPMDYSEVAKTIRNLAALGWIKVKPSADLPLPEEVVV